MNTSSALHVLGILLLTFSTAMAQVPPIGYATSIGEAGSDVSWSLGVDALGNAYVGGHFSGSMTVGSSTITSAGDYDLFVAKLDEQGDAVWATSFGWVLQDLSFAFTVDANGNSYLAGSWFYQITVDGATYDSNSQSKDVGVFKIDTNGNLVWFRTFGGSDLDQPNDIAVDAIGNVFVVGQYDTDFDFDGQTLGNNGNEDVFVMKLDSNGDPDWISTFGGANVDKGQSLALDANGNCYVTGVAAGVIDIGGVTLTAPTDNSNAFLLKFTNTGVAQWAHSIGGNNEDQAYGLAADADGNTYMAGSFRTSTSIGSIGLVASGVLFSDGFVAKFDDAGVAQWAQKIGGAEGDVANNAAVDDLGNSYFTGYFSGDIGIGGTGLSNAGGADAFVTKLDDQGNFIWADRIGGEGIDYGYGIALHPNGNCYASGFFSADMTVGSTSLSNNGDYDVYIVRYGEGLVTGINAVGAPSRKAEIGRYNPLGQRIDRATNGLQIIRYDDGSSEKRFLIN